MSIHIYPILLYHCTWGRGDLGWWTKIAKKKIIVDIFYFWYPVLNSLLRIFRYEMSDVRNAQVHIFKSKCYLNAKVFTIRAVFSLHLPDWHRVIIEKKLILNISPTVIRDLLRAR